MKAKYEELDLLRGAASFRAFRRTAPKFDFNWHYHPEIEITWIEKGKGVRLVGDSYEIFKTGDLVMIGKSLPHTWISAQNPKGKSSAVVIQFREELLEAMTALQEFGLVRKLLSHSRPGLFFPKSVTPELSRLLLDIVDKSGAEKFILLIHILEKLSHQKSKPLASAFYLPVKGALNEKRITRVCQHIQNNSSENIRTPDLAALIHMTESAFCKFFKRATGRTCSDYLNEVRIGHACHLLIETDYSISDISFRTGFESLTYFNRIFLKKKGITPRQFRKTN